MVLLTANLTKLANMFVCMCEGCVLDTVLAISIAESSRKCGQFSYFIQQFQIL